ncbi:MAG: hypothetical protein V8Q32_04005 [Anaerotignum faecicola]
MQGKSCSLSAQEAFRTGCERLGTAAEGLHAEKETAEAAFKQEMALLAEKQRKIDEAEALRPEKEGLQERIVKAKPPWQNCRKGRRKRTPLCGRSRANIACCRHSLEI